MEKTSEQLNADEAKAFAVQIKKLESKIEEEELNGDDSIDWRVAHVGDVGSNSWNLQMQEIELELEKKLVQQLEAAKAKELQRLKKLAGIAKPHVEALALKQVKRPPKKL